MKHSFTLGLGFSSKKCLFDFLFFSSRNAKLRCRNFLWPYLGTVVYLVVCARFKTKTVCLVVKKTADIMLVLQKTCSLNS